MGSSLKKEKIDIRFGDNDRNLKNTKKQIYHCLLKHGVYKLSIHSLYIYLPCTENTKAVANNRQTGPAEHFRKLKIRKVYLFLRLDISG